jgi:CHASE2 domain-containing sensor protein
VTFAQLDESEEERTLLNERFLMVGEDSAQDSFETPFGRKPGVMIHAYAVQSLVRNQFVERSPWWLSLLLIAVWCYLMIVLMARGTGNLKVILINVVASLVIIGISVLAMRVWLTWIDLIYPLLAAWLFLLLLIVLRTIGLSKIGSVVN